MSIQVKIKTISKELEDRIDKEVKVKKKESAFLERRFGGGKTTYVKPFRVEPESKSIYLPFDWALKNIPGCQRRPREEFYPIDYNFLGELRTIQREIKKEVVHALNERGSHIISLYPGAGKTRFSIYLAASKIKLKTLIVANRIILLEQWRESILSCLDPSPSIDTVTSKNLQDIIKDPPDFLLVNVENIKKFGKEVFLPYGLVCADELHSLVAENISQFMSYLSPRFLVGLSATPTRPDGMDGLMDFYFGEGNKTVRELYHEHIVYRIDTEHTFEEIEIADWTNLITAQCDLEERNKMIIGLVSFFLKKHPKRNILMLCKRVSQVKFLEKGLKEEGFKVSSLAGTKNTYDPDSQIIIGNYSKVGVGFSLDKLDTLVLCSDIISNESKDYMVQYLARVIRTKEVEPIVIDFVDNHCVLKKHFGVRKKQYERFGGLLRDFGTDYYE